MQHAITSRSTAKPPIHLIDADYDLIAGLAMSMERRSPELSKLLFDEIDRAEIHARESLPNGTVALGSLVEYLDMGTDEKRRVQLVLPAEADMEFGRLSILTPVGAGLIGLAKGQSIDWPCPSGRPQVIKILEVLPPPSGSAGEGG
jgi:regulator of nucleoside diphosphate kinase